MHIGLGLQWANLDRRVSDGEVYGLELGLAGRAEGFGSEVLPALKAHDVGGDIGVTYDTDTTELTV